MSYLFDPYNWDLSDPASIPNLLLRHIGITAISVLLGLVIAFPIALVVVRRRALYAPVITVADVALLGAQRYLGRGRGSLAL